MSALGQFLAEVGRWACVSTGSVPGRGGALGLCQHRVSSWQRWGAGPVSALGQFLAEVGRWVCVSTGLVPGRGGALGLCQHWVSS